MKIFVDTGVFIAFFLKQEQLHSQVVDKFQEYKTRKAKFYISDYVLDELLTWFISHQSSGVTKKVVAAMTKLEAAKEIQILEIDSGLRLKATQIFTKYLDHKLSFTDATTIAVFKEMAIEEIFTLDGGFSKIRLRTSF